MLLSKNSNKNIKIVTLNNGAKKKMRKFYSSENVIEIGVNYQKNLQANRQK